MAITPSVSVVVAVVAEAEPSQYLHVCIDDHSRFSHAAIRPDERKRTATAFLQHVVAHYRALGITVQRVMTDNGSCYRSAAFRKACSRLGIKHLFTQPYTPKTNGKAERLIKTTLREPRPFPVDRPSLQLAGEVPRGVPPVHPW